MSAEVPLGDIGAPDVADLLQPGQLAHRLPGQSVMEELLEVNGARDERGLLARVFGVSPLQPESRPWYSGAVGERAVGRTLAALGPEWSVLHAVPVGEKSSDIDHVVIGPTGIFTINAKHHPGQKVWTAKGTFMVAGSRYPYVRNAEHEAARAGKLLSSAVGHDVVARAAIVVVGAQQVTVKEKHRAVSVLTRNELLRWLTRKPVVLSTDQVAVLAAAAAEPATWCRTPSVLQEPAAVVQAFENLHRLVEQARRRRLCWALSVPAAVLASAAGILPPF
ncbi:NERD domain-containing protein [Arthrobacter sp. NamB2]|uniref:nuclease-related domain-containing protein n=1 Tax=Arthrobacter sp. NamB2 TaxID=2576035 RepID=UPI0010C95A68|nr:nuclease-related domain-containing protein [Arthrobacter sp. NamB2]TKV28525.1 NERD domain-containing protein [Arthrobacter sp. NamB2]